MNAARSKHVKADWYTFMRFNPFIDNIFSERSPDVHDRLRAMMGPAYTTRNNTKLEAKITNSIKNFCDYFDARLTDPSQSCEVDFSKVAQFYTMDVITDMAFGAPFGYLKTDEDLHDYHATFREQAPVISIINSVPSVGRLLNRSWIKPLWAPTAKDPKGIGKLMGMAKSTVDARIESGKQVDDMLGSFLSCGMSPQQAEAEILTQLSAGTDSNSAALRGIFLYLITSTQTYMRLRDEIDAGIKEGRISTPVTAAQATDLPYLDAVVREGMRIWPPFAGLNIKKVNPEGEVIKGHSIPGGTGIGVSFWGIQRNEVFGEDVEVFRPERWVDCDAEQRKRMEKVHDLVFGYGRYLCLGKVMVSMEIRQTIVEVSPDSTLSLCRMRGWRCFLEWIRRFDGTKADSGCDGSCSAASTFRSPTRRTRGR